METSLAKATDPGSKSKIRRLRSRHNILITDRSTWDAHNKECAEHVAPRRIRLSSAETNQGTKKNSKIINSVATKSLRTLGAGMHAGITHPARPWHVNSLPDPKAMELPAVKAILQQITERQRDVFSKSNFYNAVAQTYEDLGLFATAVVWVDEDDDDVVRLYVLPWGTYCLALDARGSPSTLFRDLPMTVAQIKDKGWLDNASEKVRRLADEGKLDTQIDIVHVVEKRLGRDITRADGKNMPWASYWYEKNHEDPDKQPFLFEWGYEECPFVAVRWSVTGNDTYGTGPTHDGLGDIKALQELEREAARAASMVTKPPMVGPSSMRGMPGGPNILPGGMSYNDGSSTGQKFEPSVKVDYNAVKVFDEKIMRHEDRIREVYFADLWLMLASTDRREITAREVDERHEEKMLQLGPVLVRLFDEFLDPLLDRIFAIMNRKGMFDDLWAEAPEEIAGQELKVEYISILAQAQKMLASTAIEKFVAFVGNIANVRPDALDRINWDEVVRHYGDILGVKPDLILPDDTVNKIRQAKQAQAQRQMQMEEEAASAATAKDLAKSDLTKDNALQRMAAEMTGGAPPQGMMQ